MMRSLILFFLLVSTTEFTMAQNSTVKGSVKDDIDKTPVASATVTVYRQNDAGQAEVGSGVTDAKGNFEISGLSDDSLLLQVSSVGYETIKRSFVITDGIADLGTISFLKQGKELADVTVVSK